MDNEEGCFMRNRKLYELIQTRFDTGDSSFVQRAIVVALSTLWHLVQSVKVMNEQISIRLTTVVRQVQL